MNPKPNYPSEKEFEDYINRSRIKIYGVEYPVGIIMKKVDPTHFRTVYNDYLNYKTTWICSNCDKVHGDKDEAEECCL